MRKKRDRATSKVVKPSSPVRIREDKNSLTIDTGRLQWKIEKEQTVL